MSDNNSNINSNLQQNQNQINQNIPQNQLEQMNNPQLNQNKNEQSSANDQKGENAKKDEERENIRLNYEMSLEYENFLRQEVEQTTPLISEELPVSILLRHINRLYFLFELDTRSQMPLHLILLLFDIPVFLNIFLVYLWLNHRYFDILNIYYFLFLLL